MSRATTLNPELVRHFEKCGLRSTWSFERIEAALERAFGAARYARYQRTWDGYEEGTAPARRLYATPRTAREAALFQSHQAAVVLRASSWLAARAAPHMGIGTKVADLGCYSGIFAAWLARTWPRASITGFERVPVLVRIARAAHRRANLRFVIRDHGRRATPRTPQFDVLLCSLGVDFLYGEEAHAIDGPDQRGSSAYWRSWAESRRVLAAWRQMARDDGRLWCVLRLSNFVRFAAWVDAADSAGFVVDFKTSDLLRVGHDRIAALAFRAALPGVASPELSAPEEWCAGSALWARRVAPAPRHAEGELFAWWCRKLRIGVDAADPELVGEAARLRFAELAPRHVLMERRGEVDPSFSERLEVGRAGAVGYAWLQASDGVARLRTGRAGAEFALADRFVPLPEC